MKRLHFEKEERAIPDQSERGIDFRSQGGWLGENFAEEPTMIRLRGLQVIVSLSSRKLGKTTDSNFQSERLIRRNLARMSPSRTRVIQDGSIKRWGSQQMIGSDHRANSAP